MLRLLKAHREPQGRGWQTDDPIRCQACGDAGYVSIRVPLGHPLFGRALLCKCMEPSAPQHFAQYLAWAEIPPALQGMTLVTFKPYCAIARSALEQAYEFVEGQEGLNIFTLYGQAGCGKTHLAVGVALALLQAGRTAFFLNVPTWLHQYRRTFSLDDEAKTQAQDALESKPALCDVLILDDIGVQLGSDWAMESLYRLVNGRYSAGALMVATVNDRTIEPRLLSRLADRERAWFLCPGEEDYRLRRRE